MKCSLKEIIEIEQAAINNYAVGSVKGVIIVDSIEEFMAQNNAIPLEDLDSALGVSKRLF